VQCSALLSQQNFGSLLVFLLVARGGGIYWLAIHCNAANLIVRGLRHRRINKTRQAPLFQEVPSTRTSVSNVSVCLYDVLRFTILDDTAAPQNDLTAMPWHSIVLSTRRAAAVVRLLQL
jgi:hypothetical protein